MTSTVRRAFIAGCFAGLACVVAPPAGAQAGSSWIVGQWELAFDEDGDPKDFVEFYDNGKLVHSTPQGQRTSGSYTVKADEVKVVFNLPGGRTYALSYSVTGDKRQLKLRSPRTGRFSVYERSR